MTDESKERCKETHEGPLKVANVDGFAIYTCKACDDILSFEDALKWVQGRKTGKKK